jgi:hypothetical protein
LVGKIILPVITIFFVTVIALAGTTQTVFAAGAISEGFAIGEALPEWIGWAIVVGLGMVFAVIITIEVKIEEKYLGLNQTSEMFNTAGRTIKTGLTAAAIVVHFGMQQEHQFKFYCLEF